MSNKMTPVEWLLDQMFNKKELKIISTHTFHISNELADKAKEMEKEQPIAFGKWILENCTFWGNEWFMYKGYRYYSDELFEIYIKETKQS